MLISASELLHKSIALYRANVQLFLSYMAWFFAPIAIMNVVAIIAGTPLGTKSPPFNITMFFIIIAATVADIWIALAFTRAIARQYEVQESIPVRQALRDARKYVLPFFFASILAGLAILGGLILFIIPAIIFSLWFGFTQQAVVLDEKHGIDALSQSKILVKGRWWKVWWRLLVPSVTFGVLILIAQSIVSFPFLLLIQSLPPASLTAIIVATIGSLLGVAAGLFIVPAASAAHTILYLELKKTPVAEK